MSVSVKTHNFEFIKTMCLIIAAYCIYFICIPPFTVNDEPDHIKIIVNVSHGQYPYTSMYGKVAKNLGAIEKIQTSLNYQDHPLQIPNFKTLSSLKEGPKDYVVHNVFSHEAYSPPLYYVVGALFYNLSKITPYLLWQLYFFRLTSTIFYFGSVFVAWKIALLLCKNTKRASSLLIFFSINPLVLKMGIGVNPDIGITFFSLFFLYIFLKTPFTKLKIKNIVWLCVLSALATLTKISGVFTNIAFTIYICVAQGVTRKTIRFVALFQALFLSLVLPWFLFIFTRYHTIFPEPFSDTCGKVKNDFIVYKFVNAFTAFRYTFMHYSGFMGQAWPHPFKWFFVGYVILFVALMLVGVWSIREKKAATEKAIGIFTIPLFIFLLTLSMEQRFASLDCDMQGRYMMPVFFVLCLFVYWGLAYVTKSEEKASSIVKGFAIFHYLFILFTVLLLRYYV